MDDLLLSVCLITYNHEKYIEQAIEGVLMQKTDFKFELIIADDCSTDRTQEILKSYKNKYPAHITLILQNINKGPAQNWLDLITAPKSKYIAYFEGDDYWTDPLKLQKQVDFLETNEEFNICFHRANLLMEDGTLSLHPIPQISKGGEFKYADLIKHYNFITTASVLFRKPDNFFFPKWFAEIPFGDMGLYFLVSRGKKIKCLNEIMSVYRIHSQGIFQSNSILQRKMQHLQFYKIIHSSLTIEEQEISTLKIREYIQEIASLKFSQSRFMQFIYKHYLSISK
ncbi:glycosyltransferase family 2 protein [Bizionia paragorgiae]|uniref:glycosyltransferase family 2 protein n=1 Tax=Bizionia paragorgiae TaxID=283786 RepID=UPI003A8F3B15